MLQSQALNGKDHYTTTFILQRGINGSWCPFNGSKELVHPIQTAC